MAETTATAGVLEGVRVAEFSQLIAAPFCGLTLLDLGAEVIKVEPRDGTRCAASRRTSAMGRAPSSAP